MVKLDIRRQRSSTNHLALAASSRVYSVPPLLRLGVCTCVMALRPAANKRLDAISAAAVQLQLSGLRATIPFNWGTYTIYSLPLNSCKAIQMMYFV